MPHDRDAAWDIDPSRLLDHAEDSLDSEMARVERQLEQKQEALDRRTEQYEQEVSRLDLEIQKQSQRLDRTLQTSPDHSELESRLADLYDKRAATVRKFLADRDKLEAEIEELYAELDELRETAALLDHADLS